MKEIPINAKVVCTDGDAGKSTAVIVYPQTKKATCFVVEAKDTFIEYRVPVDRVTDVQPNQIALNCTKEELKGLDHFIKTHYLNSEDLGYDDVYPSEYLGYSGTSYAYMDPYVYHTNYVEEEQVPPGQLALHRGTRIEAVDGKVGELGELMIDAESGNITHLLLKKDHRWQKQEVAIPVNAVARSDAYVIHLKLTQKEVELLPEMPVARSYHGQIEIVAKVFDTLGGAGEAQTHLHEFEEAHQGEVKIRNSAALEKDKDGRLLLQEEAEKKSKRKGRIYGAIVGGLVGLLAGPGGAVVGGAVGFGAGDLTAHRIDSGFSAKFLRNLGQHLEPGTSSLIVLVEYDSAEKLSEILGTIEGIEFQHALTDEIIEQIIEVRETK